MKFNNHINLLGAFLLVLLVGFSSCKIDETPDPNGPSVTDIENNATLADLQLVAAGIESSMRDDLGFYYEGVGVVGRDFYRLTNSDPRYTTDLPGTGDLDDNTFYTTRSYNARYACIRNCYILTKAAGNATGITDAQLRGFTGYAKTIRAYQLLLNANQQWNNGVRIDTEDPNNLGAFIGESDPATALQAIRLLLDEANAELAGAEFAFTLSSGFAGFDTAEDFAKFNRALAARVSIYLGDKTRALENLTNSFFDEMGAMSTGVNHVFSAGAGDQLNPLFYPFSGPDNNCAQKDFVLDAEAGDARLSKVSLRTDDMGMPDTLVIPGTGLSGTHDVAVWGSSAAPINIIRNEELILIYAEANIGTNNTAAQDALDVVRAAAGLGPKVYAGAAATETELVDQLLHERRYSLYAEGHRWIDMRRYNRLNDLPLDRTTDKIHVQFPRPFAETGG